MLERQQAGARSPVHFRLHNPFTLRVLQVFTGFGAGCGIGIGIGRPLNLSQIPVAGGALGAFPGSFGNIGHHVQRWANKLGIKNLRAGVGCGVGVGHGFGIGVALKPGTVQQLKHIAEQGLSTINERVKSFQGSSELEDGNAIALQDTTSDQKALLQGNAASTGSMSQKLVEGLVPNNPPMGVGNSRQGQESRHGEVERLQTENRILVTLLSHQEQIELLKEENMVLKRALSEEGESCSESKPFSGDFRGNGRGKAECFECRRKGRRQGR